MRAPARRPTAAMIAALWLSLAPAALAQNTLAQNTLAQNTLAQNQSSPAPGSSSPPQVTSPAAGITDQKLDAVAAAAKNVASIKTQYRQKLESATPSDQPKIADEAQAALEKAVTDQGISVEDYQSILEVAQTNQEVRAKLLQRIDASGGSTGSDSGGGEED